MSSSAAMIEIQLSTHFSGLSINPSRDKSARVRSDLIKKMARSTRKNITRVHETGGQHKEKAKDQTSKDSAPNPRSYEKTPRERTSGEMDKSNDLPSHQPPRSERTSSASQRPRRSHKVHSSEKPSSHKADSGERSTSHKDSGEQRSSHETRSADRPPSRKTDSGERSSGKKSPSSRHGSKSHSSSSYEADSKKYGETEPLQAVVKGGRRKEGHIDGQNSMNKEGQPVRNPAVINKIQSMLEKNKNQHPPNLRPQLLGQAKVNGSAFKPCGSTSGRQSLQSGMGQQSRTSGPQYDPRVRSVVNQPTGPVAFNNYPIHPTHQGATANEGNSPEHHRSFLSQLHETTEDDKKIEAKFVERIIFNQVIEDRGLGRAMVATDSPGMMQASDQLLSQQLLISSPPQSSGDQYIMTTPQEYLVTSPKFGSVTSPEQLSSSQYVLTSPTSNVVTSPGSGSVPSSEHYIIATSPHYVVTSPTSNVVTSDSGSVPSSEHYVMATPHEYVVTSPAFGSVTSPEQLSPPQYMVTAPVSNPMNHEHMTLTSMLISSSDSTAMVGKEKAATTMFTENSPGSYSSSSYQTIVPSDSVDQNRDWDECNFFEEQ